MIDLGLIKLNLYNLVLKLNLKLKFIISNTIMKLKFYSSLPRTKYFFSDLRYESMAIDYIARNIYIAEQHDKVIKVCSLENGNCNDLPIDTAAPKKLALDLVRR